MNRPEKRQTQRVPLSAGRRHASGDDLAVLARANHDMRSPLSVLLGVLELLEDSPNLNAGERRYLKFGREAATDLLGQADALRLYSALRRHLVSTEAGPVDVHTLAREQLTSALGGRPATLACRDGDHAVASCDAGYIGVALGALCKHLAAHLPTPGNGADLKLRMDTFHGHAGSTVLQVCTVDHPIDPADAVPSPPIEPGEHNVAVANAIALVELMGGKVLIDLDLALLRLTLPSEPA